MGAGGKADPTRVHISDLRSASRDPLATAVRQKLRLLAKKEAKESGTKITNGSGVSSGGWLSCIDDDSRLAVVFSSEKVVAKNWQTLQMNRKKRECRTLVLLITCEYGCYLYSGQ